MDSGHDHPPAAGPFDRFRQDHARVLVRLEDLERRVLHGARDTDDPALAGAVGHLEHQFATHMAAEDAVLFPAIEEAFPVCRATIGPLRAEHAELRLILADLAAQLAKPRAPKRDEQVVVLARDLVDLLRLHVHREESAVFEVASRALSPAEIDSLSVRLASYLDPVPPDDAGTRRQKGMQP